MLLKYCKWLYLSVFVLVSHTVNASSLVFIPSLAIGQSSLEFTQTQPGTEKNLQSAKFVIISASGTWLIDRLFINASIDMPLNDDQFYRSNPPARVNGVTTVSREDYNLTAGYAFVDWFTVFGGYSIGKTSFSSVTQPNSMGFLSEHDDRGAYAGFSFSHGTENWGSFGIDVAYASFDGEIWVRTPDPALTGLNDRKVYGDTTGYSYGIQWSFPRENGGSYFVRYKIRDYSFEAEKANNDPPPTGLEIEKDFTMLIAGMSF